ncbi:testis expressed basic protein 1 [Rhinolophus ferrumequinum]|uniref:Testis expressed basic protein 1 n=1 Tax=Rhinolophus ferrumequinum TaxID=59479 RepID=A0A7J7YU43_RHIFE|nr:testis expressed basic protein 1 [Rhinolophus ferrumequinum]
MAVLEITLAVILTLLGLAILAILLTRWKRCRKNEIDVSRYSSEQSAGLLECEDGRGFRHSYSTESDTSYDDREGSKRDYTLSANSIELSRSSIGDTKSIKAIPETSSSTAGSIMQFTAPIPGTAGPIKLSQKTIVLTPGPIAQCSGSSAGPPPMPSGLPLAPITISQRTSTHAAVPIIDSSGKITLSPVVIFPGYTDGELAKKSVPKAPVLKSGGTTKSKGSGEDKEALKKEILFTDSDESLTSMHKTESKSKAKGIALEKGKIRTEVKEKESNTGILKTQEAQVRKSEAGIPQGQEAQVRKSEAGIPQGQEAQVRKSEAGIPQGQEAQVRKSEAGIPQGQEAQVRKSEAGIPQGQEAQVRKSEAGIPQGQEAQVKKESFEDEGKQDKEKGDAEKNKDTEQNDTKNKKGDEGEDKVKGKKEPEAKGKKESSKRGRGK